MNRGFNLTKKFPRSHFQFSWLTATHFFWYNLWEFDVKSNNIHVVTCLIFLYFLFSVLLDNVLLLYGEGTYWSLSGMKKSLIYFPFWCPSSQPLTKSTGKKVLVFLFSFISYKSLTCNFLMYLPYNSIKIGHFQYIKIQTLLWDSGG